MKASERLIEVVKGGFISEEKAELLLKLCGDFLNKGELMKMSYTEAELRKVDSAYPQDYANSIRELMPSWNGMFHVYDYNEHTFGSMENVAEKFLIRLNNV